MAETGGGITPREAAVEIRIRVLGGDPVSGFVSVGAGGADLPFCGWIALMAVVNDACRDLPPTP